MGVTDFRLVVIVSDGRQALNLYAILEAYVESEEEVKLVCYRE